MLCPICNRSADRPYRRFDLRGKVTEGCVARFHDRANLIGESARWHSVQRRALGKARV